MAFGGTSFSSDTVYLPCQNGVEAIPVSSSGSFSVRWQTSTGANGSPVLGGGCVWSVDTDSGVLYALDQATGAPIAHVSIGRVPHFASPTLVGSRAFVGTDQGVTAVSGV
jgi:outer membrane protein assembly factor BamB